jgi:coatomer subunit beta
MAASIERSCSMIVHLDKPGTAGEIKTALEGNDDERKIQALKKAIAMMLSGEQIPGLFISMIRYVLPSEDHTIQRLLLLYLVRAVVNGPSPPPAPRWCPSARAG